MTNEETVMTSRARMSMLAGSELLVIRSQRQKQDLDHTGARDYNGMSELTQIQLKAKEKSAVLEVVQTSQYNPWQDPSLALGLSLSLNVNFYFHPPIIKTLNSLLLVTLPQSFKDFNIGTEPKLLRFVLQHLTFYILCHGLDILLERSEDGML